MPTNEDVIKLIDYLLDELKKMSDPDPCTCDVCEKVDINKTESTQQQIDNLRRHMGFNISELAKIMQVKRPTIYEWLTGKPPNRKSQNRLDEIYDFCQRWTEKKAGKLGRYIYRKITQDNKCLMELLEDDVLDTLQINGALDLIATVIIPLIRYLIIRPDPLQRSPSKTKHIAFFQNEFPSAYILERCQRCHDNEEICENFITEESKTHIRIWMHEIFHGPIEKENPSIVNETYEKGYTYD